MNSVAKLSVECVGAGCGWCECGFGGGFFVEQDEADDDDGYSEVGRGGDGFVGDGSPEESPDGSR